VWVGTKRKDDIKEREWRRDAGRKGEKAKRLEKKSRPHSDH